MQLTFGDAEILGKRKQTRRKIFLADMATGTRSGFQLESDAFWHSRRPLETGWIIERLARTEDDENLVQMSPKDG
ncbi:hypothetical protein [Xanthomonas sp. 3075]|uniref:hypothetical protein n=1 Tax=Xanthomonas sp. 3075 TaxID=3035315 RepID=UPI001609C615|nr:hypothetical protein [Xanthomonas sp. 3075]MBB4131487.1 hypothetical protein [Xanthomonas sp. 3075]